MARYRTKPKTIEAIQWNGKNIDEITEFVGHPAGYDDKSISGHHSGKISFDTNMGVMIAVTGCYICKDVEGKISVLTNSEFIAKYEPID